MTPDLLLNAIWQGLAMAAKSFGGAFAAHPWPFITAGAMFTLTALLPTSRRRTR